MRITVADDDDGNSFKLLISKILSKKKCLLKEKKKRFFPLQLIFKLSNISSFVLVIFYTANKECNDKETLK